MGLNLGSQRACIVQLLLLRKRYSSDTVYDYFLAADDDLVEMLSFGVTGLNDLK